MHLRLAAALLIAPVLAVASVATGAAQTVPPPTPVPPHGSPSPFPSELATPRAAAKPPELSAASATLFDLETGRVLFAESPRERRPIASLTKIMTALLVLEATSPGERVAASGTAASEPGAELGLARGERARVEDLVYALMLGSANDAAVALAEHIGGDVAAFVRWMNRRAARLGLDDTRFASPNGLEDSGYSTAADLAALTARAYRDATLREVVATRFHRVPAPSGPDRRIQNRNALLWLYPGAVGVKTGYTFAAGYCLVAAAERDGLRLGAVVLGAPSEAFSDAAALLDHGFERYERRVIVYEGEEVGRVQVDGTQVDVEAGVTLELVVERDADIELEVVALPAAGPTVDAGERVAFVRVRDDGTVIGRVPGLSVQGVAELEPPARGPSLWDGVAAFFLTVVRALFG